jgi:predicted DNA-binding protein
MSDKKQETPTTVRLPMPMVAELDRIAANLGKRKSDLIRHALAIFLGMERHLEDV